MDEMNLDELRVWLCDVQASDASPARGHVIDVAWSEGSVRGGFSQAYSSLVSLPEGKRLGRRITSLTGISSKMLKHAPRAEEVLVDLAKVRASDAPKALSVAHYARYERPFLQDLVKEHEEIVLGEFVCTHAIAKRVLPGLPRLGLRALAGYFGAHLPEHKRSEVHVMATQVIWEELVELLREEHDVHTYAQLQEFLKKPVPKGVPRTFAFSRERRLAMPRSPGVYRMLGRQGEVLYVGKATNLKQRVNSYFTGKKGEGERKLEMATQVWDVDITQVDTPLEAAVLEAIEIKRHEPPYNQVLKTGARQVWWVNAERPWQISREPQQTWCAPVSERELFEAFEALTLALAQGTFTPGALHRLHDAEVFMQGVELWREEHELGAELPAADWWVALGARLILEANARRAAYRAARDAGELEEKEKKKKKSEWTWKPWGVRRAFNGVVRRCVRHIFRGYFMDVLRGARIEWTPVKGPKAGEPHRVQVPAFGSAQQMSLEELDGLRVVMTELKRLCTEDVQGVKLIKDGAVWTGEELLARLAMV